MRANWSILALAGAAILGLCGVSMMATGQPAPSSGGAPARQRRRAAQIQIRSDLAQGIAEQMDVRGHHRHVRRQERRDLGAQPSARFRREGERRRRQPAGGRMLRAAAGRDGVQRRRRPAACLGGAELGSGLAEIRAHDLHRSRRQRLYRRRAGRRRPDEIHRRRQVHLRLRASRTRRRRAPDRSRTISRPISCCAASRPPPWTRTPTSSTSRTAISTGA